MAESKRRRLGLIAIPLALVTTFTAVGGDHATGSPPIQIPAREPGPVTIPTRLLTQRVHWEVCSFDALVKDFVQSANTTRCAKVLVPMDWKHPDAHRDIRLAIAYSLASSRSHGLLTSNPGGPGAEGLDLTAALGMSKARMFSDYDLLGFDPRGFGKSQPVRCVTTRRQLDRLPTVVDPRRRSKKAHTVEIAEARLQGEACSASEISRFINTQQTVYDLDFLRALLGYRTINYIGYSYGTWLGSWYADTFPSRVGRFILDSNMGWTGSWADNEDDNARGFERRRDQMLYPWIARNDDVYGLGDTAAKVGRTYEQARKKLVRRFGRGEFVPSPVEIDFTLRDLVYTNGDFFDAADTIVYLTTIADGSIGPDQRRTLSALLAAHAVNGPFAVQRAVDRLAGPRSAPEPKAKAPATKVVLDGLEGSVVRCNDTPSSGDISRLLRRADARAKQYPFLGYTDTVRMCSYWPYRQNPRTINLSGNLGGAPRMLMIQSEGDPATPYEGAYAAHRRVPTKTRLVSVDNEGQHGLYIDGPSACVERTGDAYLFGGRLPAADLVCGTSPLPDDSLVYRLKGPVGAHSASFNIPDELPPRTSRPNLLLRGIREQAARRSVR